MANTDQGLEKHGAEDEVRGKGNQAAGWFQKMFGKLTGNRKEQAKGTLRETAGKVQATGGQVERKVEAKLEEQDKQAEAEAQAEAQVNQTSAGE